MLTSFYRETYRILFSAHVDAFKTIQITIATINDMTVTCPKDFSVESDQTVLTNSKSIK